MPEYRLHVCAMWTSPAIGGRVRFAFRRLQVGADLDIGRERLMRSSGTNSDRREKSKRY